MISWTTYQAWRLRHRPTLVVFDTSLLYQVPTARRALFVDLVRTLAAHWIAVEARDVLPYPALPPAPDETLHNVLALDGTPLAWTRGHGQAVTWFAGPLEDPGFSGRSTRS